MIVLCFQKQGEAEAKKETKSRINFNSKTNKSI